MSPRDRGDDQRRCPRRPSGSTPSICAEVTQEEAKAAKDEGTERGSSARRALQLRIGLSSTPNFARRAAKAHVSTSALIRRLLRQAVQEPLGQLITADLESIARRVAREELRRA